MKKLLLFLIASFFFTACSVDDDLGFQESQINDVNATYSADNCSITAGEDKSRWIEISDAAAIESWDEVRKLYANMLDSGVSRNGNFEPSIWDLIDQFHTQGLGDLTTIYTVTEGGCSDYVSLTVTVVPDGYGDSTCEANAGDDNSITITESEADALESWDEVRKLYLNLLSSGVNRTGSFDPTIWELINSYQGIGEYTTTYTVGEGDCTDSVQLTVVVVADEQEVPGCDGVTAGPDNSKTMRESEAAAIESWDEVRKLYLSLLAPGISRNGTFDPSIWNLINDFQVRRTGDFTTTYTITEGNCSDSVELTITVISD